MSRFPFPMPNGWFQVAYASDVSLGSPVPVHFFARDLVLARSGTGALSLATTHPGGREGGEALPVCERNGIVWAHHHADGAPPTWEVPAIDEATSPEWTPLERRTWIIRTHPQEIGENAVDTAHFRYVHGTKTVPEAALTIDGHVRRAVQHVTYDTPRGPVKGSIAVEAHGMGCSITRFSGICETLLLISHTPIDGESVRAHFSFTQPRRDAEGPRGRTAAAVVREIVKQMEEDIPIWENKRYLERPLLCDGDGPIAAYRRWARQFYAAPSTFLGHA